MSLSKLMKSLLYKRKMHCSSLQQEKALPFKVRNDSKVEEAIRGSGYSLSSIFVVSFFLGFCLETTLIKSGYYEQLKAAQAKRVLKEMGVE